MSLMAQTSLQSGEFLDRYWLGERVASGGTGSVFRARDRETGLPVAIKILHPAVARNRVALERFRHTAEISRKLDHPGLVKVLSDDRAGDGCVVMEWVDGQPLRQIIDGNGALSPGRAIRITLAVCQALDYLHNRGVLYRDLKPENIMVDAEDRIKLIDFGMASESRGILWARPSLDDSMGTPDYASPEQLKGKRGDVRSDIYSLGIMLFEMLTGEVPFSGVDWNTAVELRALVDPPALCEVNPELSPGLEKVVDRAIARDRKDRYASVREFLSELSKLAEEASAEAPLESVGS
jgi:eukaryotic-like serine/threonine-protein kinase